ncbi:MAG TPA: hypothetical protein VHF69_13365 [Candidatus Synoicihabitans sp.]|nr:hypothetical protein [Candidatus Synoicihabitans sp.]
MKTQILASLLSAVALIAAGCSTTASVPRVNYPVSYNVQVGNTQVATNVGGQNLNVAATQQVEVEPGEPLYYRIDSPVDVTVSAFEVGRDGQRSLLGQMRGTSFTTSVMPSTSQVEFSFSASQPNSSGLVQFTLSDEPIQPRAIAE